RDRLRVALPSRGTGEDRHADRRRRRILGRHQPRGLVDLGAVADRHHLARVYAGTVLRTRSAALELRRDRAPRGRARLTVQLFALIAGLAAIVIALWDACETIVLRRSVTRRFRLARAYFRATWRLWTRLAQQLTGTDSRRERLLSIYGPLSLVG